MARVHELCRALQLEFDNVRCDSYEDIASNRQVFRLEDTTDHKCFSYAVDPVLAVRSKGGIDELAEEVLVELGRVLKKHRADRGVDEITGRPPITHTAASIWDDVPWEEPPKHKPKIQVLKSRPNPVDVEQRKKLVKYGRY